MHTPDTQQKFIERRDQGWTYIRIAAELGVAKSTLVEWSRKFRFDINNQRAIELDELHNRVLGTVQSRVAGLAEKHSRVEEELRKRDKRSGRPLPKGSRPGSTRASSRGTSAAN